jgi:hypothetical protein
MKALDAKICKMKICRLDMKFFLNEEDEVQIAKHFPLLPYPSSK